MPRRRPGTIGREESLARRIQYERERRGWSQSKLAEYVTEAGCPINQSAIWKIEVHKGMPRRRITVDELMAFADVFGLSIADLLVHPDIATNAEARELANRIQRINDDMQRLEDERGQAEKRLSEIAPDIDWET